MGAVVVGQIGAQKSFLTPLSASDRRLLLFPAGEKLTRRSRGKILFPPPPPASPISLASEVFPRERERDQGALCSLGMAEKKVGRAATTIPYAGVTLWRGSSEDPLRIP